MNIIPITVERNFHIMNDDRFIMEKISFPILINEDASVEDIHNAMNKAREIIVANFKAAYPKVYTHLNFDKTIELNKNDFIKDKSMFNINSDASLQTVPINGKFNEPTEPIDTSFNLIDEINKCKTVNDLKTFKFITVSQEEKDAYSKKIKELSI